MSRPKTVNAHLPKYVTVIHGAYWYRPPQGPNVRIGAEGDEHLVWRFMLDHVGPQAAPPKGEPLRVYFERYAREVVPKRAPRTQRDYSRALVVLDKAFGHMRPDEVLPEDIGRFLDRPTGRVQANRQVAVLSAVYKKMVGRWYVAKRNPCRDVERNEEHSRTRYVTDAEYAAVYALAGPRVRLAMDLALLTRQRQGDLLALPFKNVRADGIFFQQGKTGKRLLVVMTPALTEVIARARLIEPVRDIGGYVIHTEEGQPYTGTGFRSMWDRVVRKAFDRGSISERFTFHDLRAKSVSDSANIQEASDCAGHNSMAVTKGIYDRGERRVRPLR